MWSSAFTVVIPARQEETPQRSHAPLQQNQAGAECVAVDVLDHFPITDQGNHYVWITLSGRMRIRSQTRVLPPLPSAWSARCSAVSVPPRSCTAAVFSEVCKRPPE